MPMMSTSSGRMPKNGDGNNAVANAREVLAQSFAFYIIVLRTFVWFFSIYDLFAFNPHVLLGFHMYIYIIKFDN